jgi:hypothetical protein
VGLGDGLAVLGEGVGLNVGVGDADGLGEVLGLGVGDPVGELDGVGVGLGDGFWARSMICQSWMQSNILVRIDDGLGAWARPS